MILARRFTLCAFANFVDVLRLAADEGDRSRQILCEWTVLSDTMSPMSSSCGVMVQPNERLGDPTKYDYIVVVGGLIDEIPNLSPEYTRYLQKAAASKVPLVGVCTGAFILHRARLMDATAAASVGSTIPTSWSSSTGSAGVRPDLRRRPRPADLLGRG